MQNIKFCLVTTQSFNEGSLDMETKRYFAFASAVLGYHVYQDVWKPSIGEENTPFKTVGHLPCEFSHIAWYFLARSGEISVEVIGRKQHCKQLADEWRFHAS